MKKSLQLMQLVFFKNIENMLIEFASNQSDGALNSDDVKSLDDLRFSDKDLQNWCVGFDDGTGRFVVNPFLTVDGKQCDPVDEYGEDNYKEFLSQAFIEILEL